VPVISLFVRRSFMEGPKDMMHIPFHTDADRSVMILSLNGDGDYEGGELIYLNHQGPHHVARSPGKAIVHAAKDVHSVAPHNGTRHTLFLWGMTEAECILEGTSLQEAVQDFDPAMTQPF
jgi:predicted 2-oxoglutarate/Fe(II)-dependent dioxygenase YbiX